MGYLQRRGHFQRWGQVYIRNVALLIWPNRRIREGLVDKCSFHGLKRGVRPYTLLLTFFHVTPRSYVLGAPEYPRTVADARRLQCTPWGSESFVVHKEMFHASGLAIVRLDASAPSTTNAANAGSLPTSQQAGKYKVLRVRW